MITHVQSRAYPVLHRELRPERAQRAELGPLGLRAVVGRLPDLAYGEQATVEVDLTPAYRDSWLPDGVDVRWARLRVLESGVALCTVALRHEVDLAELDVLGLAGVDADMHRALKPHELRLVEQVLGALVDAGAVVEPASHVAAQDGARVSVHADAVRYNCHLVCVTHPWEANGRVLSRPEDLDGTSMRPLLPYTYAWEAPAGLDPEAVVALVEPADVAIAQRAVLAAAQGDSLAILHRPTDRTSPLLAPAELRRRLDRLRLTYYRLDAYRYDSSQSARSAYLAARREIGLDDVHGRTEQLLGAAAESLVAEHEAERAEFDARLNRTASILTVATAGLFVLDLILFARDGSAPPMPWRHYSIIAVLLAAGGAITWLYGAARRR